MSEARQLYDALLCALSPLLSHSVYQDVRRVRTLAWAMTGLCLRRTVSLSAWAEVAQSRSQYAARRIRRFSRWLHNRAIVPSQWYQPVMRSALSDWPIDQRLYVALDTTALFPFVLIRASLVYRGRAVPLAWRVMEHQSTTGAFEDYQPVLEQAHAALPAGGVILCLLIVALHMSSWCVICSSISGTFASDCWPRPWSILMKRLWLLSKTSVLLPGRVASSSRSRSSERLVVASL